MFLDLHAYTELKIIKELNSEGLNGYYFLQCNVRGIYWYIWWSGLTNDIFFNSKINRPILSDLNTGVGELDSCHLEITAGLYF